MPLPVLVIVLFAGATRITSSLSPTPGERAVEEYFASAMKACAAGVVPACTRLAHRSFYVTNAREQSRLVATFASACSANVMVACAAQGVSLMRAGSDKDTKRGLELLVSSCKSKDTLGCAQLAEVYLNGTAGIVGRKQEGRRLAADSCEHLGGWSCMTAAGLSTNSKEAAELLNKACDGGDAPACYELATRYAEGSEGLASDPTQATKLYIKGCDGDLPQACFNLAWQYLRGIGAKKNDKVGLELLHRACKLGDPSGCDELDRRESKHSTYCDLWGAEACFNFAAEVSSKYGETAAAAEEMVSAATRACDRGHKGACRELGHLFEDKTRQCDARVAAQDSCVFAGVLYERSPTADADRAKAAEAYQRACAAGTTSSCAAAKRLR